MGICTSEGVGLARVPSTLMEPSSIEKVLVIDSHIGKHEEKLWQQGLLITVIRVGYCNESDIIVEGLRV